MKTMINYLPLSYYLTTRLNSFRAFSFCFLYEYLPVSVLVFLTTYHDLSPTHILEFIISYICFIQVSEIFYAYNDLLISPSEINGRSRNTPFNFTFKQVLFSRLFTILLFNIFYIFFVGTPLLNFSLTLLYSLIFYVHNSLSDVSLRPYSFFFLALLRILLPTFCFISREGLICLLLYALSYYIPFRLFSYLYSKQLLLSNKLSDISSLFLRSLHISTLLGIFYLSDLPPLYTTFLVLLLFNCLIISSRYLPKAFNF